MRGEQRSSLCVCTFLKVRASPPGRWSFPCHHLKCVGSSKYRTRRVQKASAAENHTHTHTHTVLGGQNTVFLETGARGTPFSNDGRKNKKKMSVRQPRKNAESRVRFTTQ